MRILTWLISIPLFLAVIVFTLQNRFQVPISFWPIDYEITLPVSIVALGMLILGILIGIVLSSLGLIQSRLEAKGLKRKVSTLTQQLEEKEKAPLSTGPTILYNGRYQPISTLEKTKTHARKRWFERKPHD